MKDKYIKAIRDMLEQMSESEVRFVYAIAQMVFIYSED